MRFVTLTLAAFAAVAAQPTAAAPAPEINAPAEGLAVGGYDPVAYFRGGQPKRGSAHYQLRYKGAVWRFASAESLKAFLDSPEA